MFSQLIGGGRVGQLARHIRSDIHEPEMMTTAVRRGIRHLDQHPATVGRDLGFGKRTHMSEVFIGRPPHIGRKRLTAASADER